MQCESYMGIVNPESKEVNGSNLSSSFSIEMKKELLRWDLNP